MIEVLPGQVYGDLTTVAYIGTKAYGPKGKRGRHYEAQWLVDCTCGRSTIVAKNHLASGHTKTCGFHAKVKVHCPRCGRFPMPSCRQEKCDPTASQFRPGHNGLARKKTANA